jgi:hypothetical protein
VNVTDAASRPRLRPAIPVSVAAESTVVPYALLNLAGVHRAAWSESRRLM